MTQLEAQLLSIAIEAPLAALIAHLARWPSRGTLHVALASAIATWVTHPLLWAGVEAFAGSIGYWPAVLVGETAVVVAEAAIFTWGAALSPRHALILSAAANGVSAIAGLLLVF